LTISATFLGEKKFAKKLKKKKKEKHPGSKR
jgi:hypothetical protein